MASASIFGHGLGVLDGSGSPADQEFTDHVRRINVLTEAFLWRDPADVSPEEFKPLPDSVRFVIDRGRHHIERFKKKEAREGAASFPATPYIAKLMAQQREGILSEEELGHIIAGLFHSATETTSNTLMWMTYNLAREPRVQERLRIEAESVLGDRAITVDDLPRLPYMKAAVRESMRVTPTTAGTTRVLPKPILLRGYEVPAGTLASIFPHPVAMDPTVFADPSRFWPDRHDVASRPEGTTVHPHHDSPFVHMHFSRGPRMCVGARLAEVEMCSFFTRVPRRLALSLAPGCPHPERFSTLTSRPSPVPRFVISKRLESAST